MNEPVYTNEFDKPVYAVSNVHIKKVKSSLTLYELQINNQYFQITEDMLRSLADVTYMSDNISLAIG